MRTSILPKAAATNTPPSPVKTKWREHERFARPRMRQSAEVYSRALGGIMRDRETNHSRRFHALGHCSLECERRLNEAGDALTTADAGNHIRFPTSSPRYKSCVHYARHAPFGLCAQRRSKKVPVSFNSVHPRIARVGWSNIKDSIALVDHIKGFRLPSRAEMEVKLGPAGSISC